MMKLRFLLQLYVLFSGVQALNEAVPYELLYYYSAYKMEFAALPGDRTIATGCKSGFSKAKISFLCMIQAAVTPRQVYFPRSIFLFLKYL
jgi:hypothetical protein